MTNHEMRTPERPTIDPRRIYIWEAWCPSCEWTQACTTEAEATDAQINHGVAHGH